MERGRAREREREAGAAALEGLLNRQARHLGRVVVLAQVGQDEEGGGAVKVVLEVAGQGLVGEMPEAAHHPLLDEPGVGPAAQKLDVVVGFEQQEVAAAELLLGERGEVAEVDGEADAHALGGEAEGYRLAGVVGHGEGEDFDVADGEALAGAEALDFRKGCLGEGFEGSFGEKNGDVELGGERGEMGGVVGVLVGNQDAAEAAGGQPDGFEALEGFALGEPGIEQQARALGGENGGVAGRPAAQDGEFDRQPTFPFPEA